MSFARWLERKIAVDEKPSESSDVAIALGSALSPDGRSASPQSKANAVSAAQLFLGGKAKHVLLTGGYSLGFATEAEVMAKVIAGLIPPDRLLLETKSLRSWDNADNTLVIMRARGWEKAIITAQPLHSRRIKATFQKRWRKSGLSFAIVTAPSHYGGASQSRFQHPIIFLVWETIAFIYSKLRGYV